MKLSVKKLRDKVVLKNILTWCSRFVQCYLERVPSHKEERFPCCAKLLPAATSRRYVSRDCKKTKAVSQNAIELSDGGNWKNSCRFVGYRIDCRNIRWNWIRRMKSRVFNEFWTVQQSVIGRISLIDIDWVIFEILKLAEKTSQFLWINLIKN